MKRIYDNMTKYRGPFFFPSALARRVLLIFVLFLIGAGNVVAQTVTTTLPTEYRAAGTGNISIDIYDDVLNAFSTLGESLTQDNYFIRWNVVKDGNNVAINQWGIGSDDVRINVNNNGNAAHISDNKQYMYYANPWDSEGLMNVLTPTIQFGSNILQLGCKIECWITNDGSKAAADPSAGYLVKYELILNEDGSAPYALVNETDIAATKTVVPYTTYKANARVFDVSDALVSGAKYARIYLEKYGNANAQSGNLTITYDGNSITQCATGNEKYGWYLSEAGGIDVSKLNVTGLTADDMMKYNLVIVSSTNELTGDQEPAWEKKTVYSLQREIKNRINASDQTKTPQINTLQSDILTKLGATVSDFSKSLYAKWYVLSPDGVTQNVAGGNGQNGNQWCFDIKWSGLGDWTNDGTVLRYFTDNVNRTNTAIEGSEWTAQIAITEGVSVPKPDNSVNTSLSDYIGYKIVFEFSDDYDTSTNGADPGYRLKYIYTITDPSAFTGDPNTGAANESTTQTVSDRDATSVTVDLTTTAFVHSKLTGSHHAKYARFYLTDTDGNLVEPAGKLVVSYSGGTVTACTKTEQGFYIYDGPDGGGDIAELDLTKIGVQLTTPKAYKLYKVVGVFSTEMAEVVPETGATPLSREPDWDLKYTYSFTYPALTTGDTEEHTSTINWSKSSMKADASTTDPETDWGTSWDELSVGQYVKWYVTNGSNEVQSLELGSSRQADKWTIDFESPFTVTGNKAVLTGQTAFTAAKWNGIWGKPSIYAPAGMTFDEVQDYKIICEVAADDDASAVPHARYTFSLVKSFLGELKDGGTEDGETATIEKNSTSETVTLGTAQTKWGGTAKYARVWLTGADGTMVDPTGLFSVSGMSSFDGHPEYGFYVSDASGISLSDATLTLAAGQYENYKVHVALSTETGPSTYEPDYDYLYTFAFMYPVKTKYKTAIYDESSRSTTVNLLSNWYEVAGDCNASKQGLADNGYVQWYLTDADGNPLTIKNLASGDSYTPLGSGDGYYRYQFDVNNFREGGSATDSGDYTGYNPTITIPDGVDYNDVRVVCVATTQLDGMDLPSQGPNIMQVKYVFTLKTQTELESAPFVHFVGESHRPYKTVDGTPGATEASWNYETGLVDGTTYASTNIRQDVHQTDYYVYLDPSNASAENLFLTLPIENWLSSSGVRTSTEPLGYFRWYDWNTDMKSDYLEPATAAGTTKLVQRSDDRGLMAVMLPAGVDNPYRDDVGVKFTGLSALDANQEIVIACDISRYMDGMDDSKTYLVHEPTLSMRYLFHILPSSVIADDIDVAADLLNSVEGGTKQYSSLTKVEKVKLFQTYEDNGHVVVSLNRMTGLFALRAGLQGLDQYFINNSGNPVQCNQIQWYSYYVDDEGLWKMKVDMNGRESARLAKYQVSDFNGTYTKVGSTETKTITVSHGTDLDLVGYLGNGSVEQAVVHYGLEFLDEKPEKLGSESLHRTDDYMYENLTLGNVLDFNDFFVDETARFDKPTTSYDNYAKIPMVFENAQYGFCYPQLYGQCASNWGIHHGGWWEGYGFAPTHSDYTLLKSMNVAGVSASQTFDNQAFYTFWYDEVHTRLYDVTHERLDLAKTGNDAKYGTYLYIDAADEARTIAQLQFTASLCAGSEIYYTAYIANMTGLSQTPPQVMFRVSTDVTEGGVTKRIPVVSFLTGDIMSEGANTAGEWYQVYGFTKIPKELENVVDGSEHTYYVSIDNYSENTDGADYAVDQISFFTSSATVQVTQSSTPCDESSGVEVAIIASADELINVVGQDETKNLYYRIFEKSSDPNHVLSSEDAVSGPYKNAIVTYENVYGSVEFTARYDRAALEADNVYDQPKEGTTGFYISSNDDKVYYQFDKREFDLKMGKSYFVSFLEIGMTAAGAQNLSDWGNPYGNKICSTVFSNDITPKLLRIDLESGGEVSDGTIALGCGVPSVPKSFLITVQYPTIEGYSTHTDVMFDFYLGSKVEFKSIKEGDLYLEKALEHMRATYTDAYSTSADLPTTWIDEAGKEYDQEMHDLIAQYMDNGLLNLASTRQFDYTFTAADAGEKKFAAIPVSRVTTDGYICSPLEFAFDVEANSNGPKMELGFDDVNYPEDYTKRVVRVGLEQLNKMKDDGFKLHIPVSNFQNKGAGKDRKLHFSNPILTVSATNDPTIDLESTPNLKVAKVFDPSGGSNATDVYVDMSRMYLPLDFSGENCQVDFHEGYYYETSISFYDEEEQELDESQRCIGDLFIVFKVVPEFVTWNAKEVNTGLYSGNWYNDDNWNRSERAELYKDDAATHSQNSATAGHPSGALYKDNPEIDASLTERPGFIPMKFTYVTMLGNNHSPSLFREAYTGAEKIPGTLQTGGDLINPINEMGTDTSPSGGSSYPTDYIRYDMLVRYGTHAEGGEGCFGHRYMSGNSSSGYGWNTSGADVSALTNVYDVEKFYGNICKEIYFKPGAELRLQQRLTYEKAWVEKELVPNKWYLMSTPLKGTYAGDMYVPATPITDYSLATPATVTGRQVTEAFQPITFDKTKGYSRTLYPIYQRSWGQTAKVYTKTDDVRATDYSAKINFGSVSSSLVEWGHTYNDVQVPYTGYSGFAIRAHRKDQTDNALIRLPKADTQYDYYQWDDQKPSTGAVAAQTVTKGTTVYGRLVYDNQGGGFMSGDLEQWSIPLANLQAQGTDEDGYTYYLVGNPFVASIDMGKFFGYQDGASYYSYNPKLDPVYYTYEAGTVTAVDARTDAAVIRPLQAFVVKCKDSDAPDNIVFNRWAITDGNYTPPTTYSPEGSNGARSMTQRLMLTATNGFGSSKASVRVDSNATDGYLGSEDVMSLFDSNLSDVPMVFTMASGHALSIDTRPTLDLVPFGVACASSNEPVEVSLSANFSHLYVFDAVTEQMTAVDNEGTFTVQPNDYGRYFLTTRSDLTGISSAGAWNIMISVRNRQLTVCADSSLKTVRILTVRGETVATAADVGTEASFSLHDSGIYIIEAETENDRTTKKVMVK